MPRWIRSGHIPRGTAVDPALFPEDKYPVECLRCGYDLHGLPDGRCPECGQEFERGHLLVESYARNRWPGTGKFRRATDRICRSALVVVVSATVVWWSLYLVRRVAPAEVMEGIVYPLTALLMLLAFAVGGGALLVSAVLDVAASLSRPPHRKRRAVRRAAIRAVSSSACDVAGPDRACPR